MKNIKLKALHPTDIVATKIGRLDERDLQDIQACIEKCKLTNKQIKERAQKVEYIEHTQTYKTNLSYVLQKFFKN